MRSRRRREVARFSEPQWREEQPITAAVTSRHSANQRPRCRHSGPGRECRRGTWNRSPGCQMLYGTTKYFLLNPNASDRKYKNIFTRKIFVEYSLKIFSTTVKSVSCKRGEGKSEWESRMRSALRLVAGCQSCRGRAGPGPLPAAGVCGATISGRSAGYSRQLGLASASNTESPTLASPPPLRHTWSCAVLWPRCEPEQENTFWGHFVQLWERADQ